MISFNNYIGLKLDDRYLLDSVLGEGGMSVVYRALDTRLDRQVAVKVLRADVASDDEKKRFIAESHAVALLSHPNIVGVYDVSTYDGIDYIVMELIDGITLRQYMDKKGKINWKEALHFSRQIASALSHAHQKGIIHRDIKPQNIMLLRDGTIKVADFGIAAMENEIDDDENAIGSIHYIAPEQARGEAADARSDIYALGIVMYEMLCGMKPYVGDSINEIAIKHINGVSTPIENYAPDTPGRLIDLISVAMSPETEYRFSSAGEFYEALDAFYRAQAIRSAKRTEQNKSKESQSLVPDENRKRYLGKSGKLLLQRKNHSGRVSFLTGLFALLLSIVFLFAFLWNFWLSEVFSPAERIEVPNLIGSNYNYLVLDEFIANNFRFELEYIIDTSSESGIILSQEPAPGRSMMRNENGVTLKLTISTGAVLSSVPDVRGFDYREAVLLLQNSGFNVDIENAQSSSVERDKVISISPGPGEQISAGSTVYLSVSIGEQLKFITMPNLIGLTEDSAIAKLQRFGLVFGGTEKQRSEYESGTVIGQSTNAFAQIEEHAKVYLVVSSGPG